MCVCMYTYIHTDIHTYMHMSHIPPSHRLKFKVFWLPTSGLWAFSPGCMSLSYRSLDAPATRPRAVQDGLCPRANKQKRSSHGISPA